MRYGVEIDSLVRERDEARRDEKIEHALFVVAAEKHSEWLENYMRLLPRAQAAEARCEKLAVHLRDLLDVYVVTARSAGFPEELIDETVRRTVKALKATP